MSLGVETINLGPVNGFGFEFEDRSRVMLAEMSPMATSQFCQYSTDTLLQAMDLADAKSKDWMIKRTIGVYQQVADVPIRRSDDLLRSPRLRHLESELVAQDQFPGGEFALFKTPGHPALLDEMAAAEEAGDQAKKEQLLEELMIALRVGEERLVGQYAENPFQPYEWGVEIGHLYQVQHVQFTLLSTYVLGGGMNRWSKHLGIPEYAHFHLKRLFDKVST